MTKRLLIALFAVAFSAAAHAQAPDPANTVYLDLEYGRVVILMRPDLAPRHVARLKHLIQGGYYDGLVFHRVIDGFAAQTGDTKNDGTGAGTGQTLRAEFSRTPQVRGTVSMARGAHRNSADAEWFMVLADKPETRSSLDGKYTVWGSVVSGMEFVDQIPKGDPSKDGRGIVNPARIVKMQLAVDADAVKEPLGAILQRAEIADAAKTFSAAEFKCSGLINGDGVTTQSALARLWTYGYMAGRFKANNALSFTAENTLDSGLDDVCAAFPTAFLLTAASQELAKTPRALPANVPAFPLESYTCKAYETARKASNKDEAELTGLWAFAFIQGFKNVSQPEMEIPNDSRPRLLAALSGVCAKSPDLNFTDVTGAVAERVRIK